MVGFCVNCTEPSSCSTETFFIYFGCEGRGTFGYNMVSRFSVCVLMVRLRTDHPKELIIRHGSSGAKDKMRLDINSDCSGNAV
jgi:hypothetical protein